MADGDDIDSVELAAANADKAIEFVKNNIDAEADSIEIVKNAADPGYMCTARGLPTE